MSGCLDDEAATANLCDFPIPAYELANISRYFLGTIQFRAAVPTPASSAISPASMAAYLGSRRRSRSSPNGPAVACGVAGSVYFVDDNFVGNRRACGISCRISSNAKAQRLCGQPRLRGDPDISQDRLRSYNSEGSAFIRSSADRKPQIPKRSSRSNKRT